MASSVGVHLLYIVGQVSNFPDGFGRNIMGKTIQSVFRSLLRLNVISIFVPLLAIVGIIWAISLFGVIPTVWSAVATAVVAVLVAVFQIVQGFPLKSTKSRQEMDRLIQLYK